MKEALQTKLAPRQPPICKHAPLMNYEKRFIYVMLAYY